MRLCSSIVPLLVCTSVFAQQPATDPAVGVCSLSGSVTQAGPQPVPVRHAVVIATESTSAATPLNATGTTDDAGRFQLNQIAAGRDYFVHILKAGVGSAYFNGSRHLRPAGRIQCRSGDLIHGYTIQVASPGTIIGEVRDDEGELLARARVEIYKRTTSGYLRRMSSGTANVMGTFQVTVPPGRYIFRAQPPQVPDSTTGVTRNAKRDAGPELVPTYYPGVASSEAATGVPVGAGEESRVSIQLLRLPTVRVSGKINGWKPDFNATASLSEIATGDSFSGGIDGKTGEFTFTGVHFGRYEMNVTANQSPLRTNDDAELEFGPVLVGHAVLEVQQQNTMVNIVLAPAPADREINGTLSTETKAPLPLSTVTIALLDPADLLDLSVSTFVARAAVDEKGAFSAEVRGGRKAFVGVESREDAWSNWYVKNVLLDGRDISESGIASTDPGGKLQVILSDGGGIVEGVALDRDSHPVPDAYVMMFPDGKPARFDVWQYGKADANGSFTLRGIPPMSYVVAAWETEPNRDDLRDPAFVNRALQTGSKVTVASRTAKKVEVLAQPPAEIP